MGCANAKPGGRAAAPPENAPEENQVANGAAVSANTTCMMCRRPAADGFRHCCQTCEGGAIGDEQIQTHPGHIEIEPDDLHGVNDQDSSLALAAATSVSKLQAEATTNGQVEGNLEDRTCNDVLDTPSAAEMPCLSCPEGRDTGLEVAVPDVDGCVAIGDEQIRTHPGRAEMKRDDPQSPGCEDFSMSSSTAGAAGKAHAETTTESSPERRIFSLLDRSGKGRVSQRDVLLCLKKHAPIRRLFGLPASPAENGGENLDARLLAIQDAFEAGTGLGEVKQLFDKIKGDDAAQTFGWTEFLASCQKRPMSKKIIDAAALFPRLHVTGAEFIATKEWAVVPEGAVCPAGLEILMDMETGRTLARLSSTNEKGKKVSG